MEPESSKDNANLKDEANPTFVLAGNSSSTSAGSQHNLLFNGSLQG
jgi:hypothetical protein